MSYSLPLSSHIRWLSYRNDSGETVPPFAALKPTGMVEIDGAGVVTCDKPDADDQVPLFFNGPAEVAADGYGRCTADFPAVARYSGSAPSVGDTVGAADASWSLEKDATGYDVVAVDTDNLRCLILATGGGGGVGVWYGTIDSDLLQGGLGTVDATAPESVTLSDCLNPFGDIAAGASVFVCEISPGGAKYIIAASCPV